MKKTLTILSLVSLILFSCSSNVNDKAKIEKALLDSIKKVDSLKSVYKLDSLKKGKEADSLANLKRIKDSIANIKISLEKKLIDKEYGKYTFVMPAVRAWYLTFKFIANTNNVTCTESHPNSQTMSGSEDVSTGTFIVDKVNNDFKYVTCKFKNNQTYILKYSIKKNKWFLITDGFDGNKTEIEAS